MEGFYWPFFDPFLDWLSDWERGIDLKVVDKKGERCIVELCRYHLSQASLTGQPPYP